MKVLFSVLLCFLASIVLAQTSAGGNINGLVDNFNIKLYSIQTGGVKVETDGTRAKFGASYCACVDGDDAVKFMGSGIENISLLRDGASLVIEARPYITSPDTLYLKMEGMNIGGSYEFQFTPTNFDTSVAVCRIYDHFLNKDTIISLSTVSSLPFEVTAVAGSDATNRFSIVFYPTLALAENIINIKAAKMGENIIINWESNFDAQISHYDVEKSLDGTTFKAIHNQKSNKNSALSKYSYVDIEANKNGVNFYRIKATDNQANAYYSSIVNINSTRKSSIDMAVFPNPVTNNNLYISIHNAGRFKVKLLDFCGKIAMQQLVENINPNGLHTLNIPTFIDNGLYSILVEQENGYSENRLIFIKR